MLAISEQVDEAFARDVLDGLAQKQPAVPARWFYDERGSALFDDITRLPEYYPTRTELAILSRSMGEIAAAVGTGRAVVDYGAGSQIKTPLLLEGIDPALYVPVDISGVHLRASAEALQQRFPDLAIEPVEADFAKPFRLPPAVDRHPVLGFFPGSTIGNFVPASAIDLLRSFRATLGVDALLLIGVDRIKDRSRLIEAYDDAQGVTAAFNRNLLERINRELGGTVPIEAFRHEARWNAMLSRVEMHLVAARDVTFEVVGRTFRIAQGGSIHTENSHKYTSESARLLLAAGGWTPLQEWTDGPGDFSLLLARAEADRMAP
ncbi:L-histidine N(alpha)-methyltransferase [Sphingomonas astaxanthinifaciens]|uniref:Dimethylhistidine N-methyltransferase n=1 Tax=Sphingomonas astaxanthinifaciens DSM 22298 TaxID=1123267 RepID=A0ABQ5Z3I5_9SPHN|nr:L-histidine N(alpha)-methyltransferase [Sphingomonas astaxanthinifaciens]GLR46581.1 dimethylhistidine N-methyltransferase [Sphingomonas astaxanthinifaciens DSM 22298]